MQSILKNNLLWKKKSISKRVNPLRKVSIVKSHYNKSTVIGCKWINCNVDYKKKYIHSEKNQVQKSTEKTILKNDCNSNKKESIEKTNSLWKISIVKIVNH